jgi:periplasmic copper chaperone A
MGLLNRGILAAAFGLAATGALAHVVVEPKGAAPGSYTKVTFRVGHGCDAAATTALVVTFPEDVKIAHAQPKAGWALEVKKEPVVEMTWRGRLETDYFDDFAALIRVPDKVGQRRFVIKQECEGKTANWDPAFEVGK